MSPFRGQLSGRPLPASICASHGGKAKVQGVVGCEIKGSSGARLMCDRGGFSATGHATRRRKSTGVAEMVTLTRYPLESRQRRFAH